MFFRKYDLKGSTVDREASHKELEKDLPTLKDNDFMKDEKKIYIGDIAKKQLMETLTADVEVSSLNIKLEIIYILMLCFYNCYSFFIILYFLILQG